MRAKPSTVLSLLCVVAAVLFASCRRGAKTEGTHSFKREYSMQVTMCPTTYWGMGATRFAELVAEKTSGRIKVKPYFSSQLLSHDPVAPTHGNGSPVDGIRDPVAIERHNSTISLDDIVDLCGHMQTS